MNAEIQQYCYTHCGIDVSSIMTKSGVTIEFVRISGERSLFGRFFSGPAGFRRTLLAYTPSRMHVGVPPLGPEPWPFRTNKMRVHGVIADVAGNVALHTRRIHAH